MKLTQEKATELFVDKLKSGNIDTKGLIKDLVSFTSQNDMEELVEYYVNE